MTIRRLAGISGLAFVGAVGVATLAQGAAGRPFGDPDDPSHLVEYAAYYSDADWIPALLAGVVPIVWLSLAMFAVGLAATLARGDWQGSGTAWLLLGILGVTMQNSVFQSVVAADVAQFGLVADGAGMDLGLHGIHEVLFTTNSTSLAIALIGFSAAMRHWGGPPRWLPLVGFTGAGLLLASTSRFGVPAAAMVLEALGLIGFILWLTFIASSGLWLLRRANDAMTGAPGMRDTREMR